jgi:predicted AlkP superfamily phosphohydrolase/phosphomutase
LAKRLIFLGLDGVGLEQARGLARRGVMPHLAELLEAGRSWGLDSPLPEVSPVCWTSLFSGANPGEHGVFGFGEPLPGSYQVRPVDSRAVRVPRLWDRLTRAGRPAVVAGVPLTYPASPIQGVMVSGFVAPELSRAVHPSAWLARLEAMGYRPEAELELGREDRAALAADLARALEDRLELFRRLWAEPWELFCAVITDTDRANHFLWPALQEAGHPLAEAALEVFRRADGFLGWVWQRARPWVEAGEADLVVAADHSFGPIRSEVYLNPWLQEQGLLAVEGPAGAERILPQTRALALDPGRVYLHDQRFPGGSRLLPGEAQSLRAEIAAGLQGLAYTHISRDNGQMRAETLRPVARAHLREELYAGPAAGLGPDLVAEAAPGFSLRAGLDRGAVFGTSHLAGTHRPAGALALWAGSGGRGAGPGHIQDLHPLLARALGLEPPQRFAPAGPVALH